jgi:predicted RNA binding protein YcfA (HicA-like mRNA interferase family)
VTGVRPLPARKVLRALERLGFVVVRRRGSHVFLRHPDGRATVVPVHPGEDIGRGLVRKIIRDAGVEVDVFLEQV